MNVRLSKWLKNITIFEDQIDGLPIGFNYGYLTGINGIVLEVTGLNLPIGSICFIESIHGENITEIECEVIGFKEKKLLLIPIEEAVGIQPNSRVFLKLMNNKIASKMIFLPVGLELLGRVLDGLGRPLDELSRLNVKDFLSLEFDKINPLQRFPITDVLDTGVRSINALLTIGRGQRMGLFSSSGLGKSVLLGMIARYTQVDIIIIAMIGERSREVKDFINNILGVEGLSRSIVIAVPADHSPLLQIKGAVYATRIAEYFRNNKYHVLLIMDSLTRYAMAHREIALSMGELPATKGYPPSVFSKLSTLVERAGNGKYGLGSITAFYTVLTEINADNDPVAESVRSFLDGHIILSRFYAESGHYPAIDIESSISRLMPNLVDSRYYLQVCHFKKLVSVYQRNQELISVGAYVSGSNLILDQAIKIWSELEKFLKQDIKESHDYINSCETLKEIFQ
ncbi:FliI/YscN family ATPase [Buchnera aphidicola]|uniref:FliI/YscN family ATPase n=1 Tax=Buchnera aphidicola TaxID=9 RepID=UPI003464B752